jgi:hypothetical protein
LTRVAAAVHHREDLHGVAVYLEIHDVREIANERTSSLTACTRVGQRHLGDPVKRVEDRPKESVSKADLLPIVPERRLDKVGLDTLFK